MQEFEKDNLARERLDLDIQIRKYSEECERIQQEELFRRKKHQDDLKYQMDQKEKMKHKEIQDKIYEERAAKLWEMEYQRRINEQKEQHKKRVIDMNFKNNLFNFS